MKTSETIKEVVTALLAAQKEITHAQKNKKNPHFKSTYADLSSVIDAVKQHLNDNGLIFTQSTGSTETGDASVFTRIIHVSGEWIESHGTCKLVKNDAQGLGSAITYLRRYGLAGLTGLYQDDDDGGDAGKPLVKISFEQKEELEKLIEYTGVDTAKLCEFYGIKAIAECPASRFQEARNQLLKKKRAKELPELSEDGLNKFLSLVKSGAYKGSLEDGVATLSSKNQLTEGQKSRIKDAFEAAKN